MLTTLTRNWWMAAVRGVLAVLVGVIAFGWPGITYDALVLLFGAYALVNGGITLAFGLMAANENSRWWSVATAGFIGVATGLLTFMYPSTVGQILVYAVGAWAIVTGALEIVAAVRLRTIISGEWLMALGGALSVLFGVLIIAQPNAGAITLIYLFGLYAILVGVSEIGLGLRLRSLGEDVRQASVQTASSTSRP
jgi:uncharacterized membrane protein HdeD (DUF308 family)